MMKNMRPSHPDTFGDREVGLHELNGEPWLAEQYAEDEDVVTRALELPLDTSFPALTVPPGEPTPDPPQWTVALTARDRRLLSSSQISSGLQRGELQKNMLVWRQGMPDWLPIAELGELAPRALPSVASAPAPAEPPLAFLAHPPPTVASPLRGMPQARKRSVRPELPMQLPPLLAPALTSGAAFPRAPANAAALDEMSPDHMPSMRVKRAVMAMSALAMLGVFLTMYVISSGRDATPERDLDAQPRPVRAVPAAKASRAGVFAKDQKARQETEAALLAEGNDVR